MPFPLDSDWVIMLRAFKFKNTPKGQANDLINFFSLAFDYANKYPKEAVLKYAIKCINELKVFKENWRLFKSLILKALLADTNTIPHIASILIKYKKWVSKRNLSKALISLIQIHSIKGHSFEISWALWLADYFRIKIPIKLAIDVFQSNDYISILLALKLRKDKLISNKIGISFILDDLEKIPLFSDKWLLLYVSIYNGWVPSSWSKIINRDDYFRILKKYKVNFYEEYKAPFYVTTMRYKRKKKTGKTLIGVPILSYYND